MRSVSFSSFLFNSFFLQFVLCESLVRLELLRYIVQQPETFKTKKKKIFNKNGGNNKEKGEQEEIS